MNIENAKILVLGGYGLVGAAVCRELLARRPREIQIHSLRLDESLRAAAELAPEAGDTLLSSSAGDIFNLGRPEQPGVGGKAETGSPGAVSGVPLRERIRAELRPLDGDSLPSFLLYRLLLASRPEVVVDCVNTATGIAYGDIFSTAEALLHQLEEGRIEPAALEQLLSSLYMPRLIRHIQVLYRGMLDAGTRVYVKVGTSGTGGMGLNIPYTHSEEKPSRVLLSKSAVAGAQSMLLFLMGRTPGAPVTKEIKPAAAIAWKRIGYGPILRKGRPIARARAWPRPLGRTFSSFDPSASSSAGAGNGGGATSPGDAGGTNAGEPFENVFIDTGENGVFSLEEFITVTSAEQMEFVTPEEIARYLVFEIEGGNTGHDIVAALDGAVLGPTYRAGLLRERAIERMRELERCHGVHSVAFEMLGPPRNSKLLFEAHLLRLVFDSFEHARRAGPEELRDALDRLVRERPAVADDAVAVGIPVLLDSGELLRGPEVLVPPRASEEAVTPERLEKWVAEGWVDLRLGNCRLWHSRFQAIQAEIEAIPAADSSSRFVRDRRFWDGPIQPGKLVGWVLSEEEKGSRLKR